MWSCDRRHRIGWKRPAVMGEKMRREEEQERRSARKVEGERWRVKIQEKEDNP